MVLVRTSFENLIRVWTGFQCSKDLMQRRHFVNKQILHRLLLDYLNSNNPDTCFSPLHNVLWTSNLVSWYRFRFVISVLDTSWSHKIPTTSSIQSIQRKPTAPGDLFQTCMSSGILSSTKHMASWPTLCKMIIFASRKCNTDHVLKKASCTE